MQLIEVHLNVDLCALWHEKFDILVICLALLVNPQYFLTQFLFEKVRVLLHGLLDVDLNKRHDKEAANDDHRQLTPRSFPHYVI